MTVLPEQLGEENNGVVPGIESRAAPRGGSDQVLITEHEVRLGSAIATSAPLPGSHPGIFRRFTGGLHRMVTWSPDAPRRERPNRRAYPQRTPDWYSDALMAREMRRL